MEIINPTVHLNGTSRDELVRQYEDAASAVREAQIKLRAMAPNARDYYPQGPDAFGRAQKEHNRRIQTLDSLYDEIHALWECLP